jgi:hypothetical protein
MVLWILRENLEKLTYRWFGSFFYKNFRVINFSILNGNGPCSNLAIIQLQFVIDSGP